MKVSEEEVKKLENSVEVIRMLEIEVSDMRDRNHLDYEHRVKLNIAARYLHHAAEEMENVKNDLSVP